MLPIHIIFAVLSFCIVVVADSYGFSWIRGKRQTLAPKWLSTLHYAMWIGLVGLIVTGAMMAYPMREYLLTRPQFIAKMGFVLALVVNGFAIGNLLRIAERGPYATIPKATKVKLFISGAISTVSWIGAATLAFFLIED
jgi:hypothetical protein